MQGVSPRESRGKYSDPGIEEPSTSIVDKTLGDIARASKYNPSPRKRLTIDVDQEERMMYGHREAEEDVRPKAKTLTFVDVIQKRENPLKKSNKTKYVPFFVDLEGKSGQEEASVEGSLQDGHQTVPKGDPVE
uniref:Uncharacterized protein n=1 Tax=Picea glauca TaxID=3330 RepID=A0A101LWJ2_PICGL|nr:hypothetical protein ABT39_MTgene1357 [Picea glauca]QHR89490.1 hypothetical protein Q903MT_gene3511 [Picea sitchensis]